MAGYSWRGEESSAIVSTLFSAGVAVWPRVEPSRMCQVSELNPKTNTRNPKPETRNARAFACILRFFCAQSCVTYVYQVSELNPETKTQNLNPGLGFSVSRLTYVFQVYAASKRVLMADVCFVCVHYTCAKWHT